MSGQEYFFFFLLLDISFNSKFSFLAFLEATDFPRYVGAEFAQEGKFSPKFFVYLSFVPTVYHVSFL